MPSHIVESTACRRLVGHLSGGGELSQALVEICTGRGVRAGEVRATGVLSDVELSAFDPATRGFRSVGVIEGPVTLICAYGNVTELGSEVLVGIRAVVGWGDRDQFRVAAGHVLQAKVVSVEVVVDAFDDVVLGRRMDPELGLPVMHRVERTGGCREASGRGRVGAPRPSAPPLPAQRPTGWSDVVEMSKKLDEEEDAGWVVAADMEVRRGDVFLHPRFGRCTVVRLEAEERAVMRDEEGKPRTLSLEYIRVRLTSREGVEPRVFALQVSGKRR